MAVLNPPIDRIKKDLPVCQYPRESYNRIAEIVEHFKAAHGLRMTRGGPSGDYWTISVDEAWLYGFIAAYVAPMIDSAQQETEKNGGGGITGYTGTKTVVTDVAWDETNHKWTKTTEAWTYTNGALTSVAAATTSDIVTAVQEMP